MLATAAKLSRALAATFGVLLSKLALGVQPGSFVSGAHYPLLASAESAANGFWQIVSITLKAAPRQTGNCQKLKIQTSEAAEQSAAFFFSALSPLHIHHRNPDCLCRNTIPLVRHAQRKGAPQQLPMHASIPRSLRHAALSSKLFA